MSGHHIIDFNTISTSLFCSLHCNASQKAVWVQRLSWNNDESARFKNRDSCQGERVYI